MWICARASEGITSSTTIESSNDIGPGPDDDDDPVSTRPMRNYMKEHTADTSMRRSTEFKVAHHDDIGFLID